MCDTNYCQDPFNVLPQDILINIFSQVPLVPEYFKLSQVSTKWKQLSRSDQCCSLMIREQVTIEDYFEPELIFYQLLSTMMTCYSSSLMKIRLSFICSAGFEKLFVSFSSEHKIGWTESVSNGLPPFAIAIREGRVRLTQLLLPFYDMDQIIAPGRTTPLHFACMHGHPSIVKLLLTKGDVNMIRGFDKATVLLLAVERNHLDVVALLLDRGADPNIAKSDFDHPLVRASMLGHTEIVNLLIKRSDLRRDLLPNSFLVACKSGNVKVAKLILSFDPEIKSDPKFHSELVHQAASLRHTEIFKFLLEDYSEPNQVPDETTLVSIALENKHEEMAGFLMDQQHRLTLSLDCNNKELREYLGVHSEPIKKGDCTPFLLACQNGHLEIARFLIEWCELHPDDDDDDPIYPEHRLTDPNIALYVACWKGELENVQQFLYWVQTPLDEGHVGILQHLRRVKLKQ